MTKKERIKNALPLESVEGDSKQAQADQKLLSVIDAFTVAGEDDTVIYVNHHGFETPGHIIFDGKVYRTSRTPTYATLTEAALAFVRGN